MNSLENMAGKLVVAKLGGNVIDNESALASVVTDIVLLADSGCKLVVVHGGGSSIDAELKALGIEPKKVGGLRVTDAETLFVVADTLEEINKKLCNALTAAGSLVAPFPPSTKILSATRALGQASDGSPLDIGYVGKIEGVRTQLLKAGLSAGIPVVAPIGYDDADGMYNVNADHAAVAIAAALNADSLLFLSDVPGVLLSPGDPASLIKQIPLAYGNQLIESNVVTGGMRPKLQTAMSAVSAGVESVVILDGTLERCLLNACISPADVGTLILN